MDSPVYLSPVAKAVPFDKATNNFDSLDTQSAIEEATSIVLFGDGSDGIVSLSSGTTTLSRTMFYSSLTLSGTAVVNTNGFKIFVKNKLTISGSARISNNGANGNNGVGNTPGAAPVATPGVEFGTGQSGGAGAAQNTQAPVVTGTVGYGNNGGSGGAGGANGGGTPGGASQAGGVVTFRPERVLRQEHQQTAGTFKDVGAGGAGGSGGSNSLLATAAAGGSGGSGGGAVLIFSKTFENTSSAGVTAIGGNGGNGGNAVSGNSGGGGGGGGAGGGFIYIVSLDIISVGTLNVAGGVFGIGGAPIGTGTAGSNGTSGTQGHTSVFHIRLGSWTVT